MTIEEYFDHRMFGDQPNPFNPDNLARVEMRDYQPTDDNIGIQMNPLVRRQIVVNSSGDMARCCEYQCKTAIAIITNMLSTLREQQDAGQNTSVVMTFYQVHRKLVDNLTVLGGIKKNTVND